MKCARCKRTMLTPAATVQTRAGRNGYAPKCAAAMGILPAKTSAPARRTTPARTTHDERQADWIAEAAR